MSWRNDLNHLGTLAMATFIEICSRRPAPFDHAAIVSRGVGKTASAGLHELGANDMRRWMINLPDQTPPTRRGNGSLQRPCRQNWAQKCDTNHELMMAAILDSLRVDGLLPPFTADDEVVTAITTTWRSRSPRREGVVSAKARARGEATGIVPQHGEVVHRAGKGNRRASIVAATRRRSMSCTEACAASW